MSSLSLLRRACINQLCLTLVLKSNKRELLLGPYNTPITALSDLQNVFFFFFVKCQISSLVLVLWELWRTSKDRLCANEELTDFIKAIATSQDQVQWVIFRNKQTCNLIVYIFNKFTFILHSNSRLIYRDEVISVYGRLGTFRALLRYSWARFQIPRFTQRAQQWAEDPFRGVPNRQSYVAGIGSSICSVTPKGISKSNLWC